MVGTPQIANVRNRIAQVLVVLPNPKQWLILGPRSRIVRSRTEWHQLGLRLPSIENGNRFAPVNGTKDFFHAVAQIHYARVHRVSLYKYAFERRYPMGPRNQSLGDKAT
jgi:hypothetical protein